MRNAGKISQRAAALRQELDRIPDPAAEAAKKRHWEKAIDAFAHGDPEPPDDHVETQAMWDTLVCYHDVFLKARQGG